MKNKANYTSYLIIQELFECMPWPNQMWSVTRVKKDEKYAYTLVFTFSDTYTHIHINLFVIGICTCCWGSHIVCGFRVGDLHLWWISIHDEMFQVCSSFKAYSENGMPLFLPYFFGRTATEPISNSKETSLPHNSTGLQIVCSYL